MPLVNVEKCWITYSLVNFKKDTDLYLQADYFIWLRTRHHIGFEERKNKTQEKYVDCVSKTDYSQMLRTLIVLRIPQKLQVMQSRNSNTTDLSMRKAKLRLKVTRCF